MNDALGRLSAALADRYRIERELGAGGMATVYLAQDVRHDRKVAVKVLRPELASILGGERFLAEIKTTANLQHPHILSLFDSGEADGQVFYVMPYVEGESLRDRLTRQKQLPVDEAVGIAGEVADALAYAHQQGVVHRDIKPENILLHGGHALVVDFGIALAASRSEGGTRMTETGMSLGTPHYMAPEQAMGEREITPKADIYALGCVLYEMLTGEPPFTGPTAQAIIARVMTEEPRSLTLQRRTVPPHVEATVRMALEKLPADRFGTAAQFAEALGNPAFGTASTGAIAQPATAPGGGLRTRLKDPVVLGFALLAVVSLAVSITRRPAAAPAAGAVRFLFAGSDSARVIDNFPWPAAISPDGGILVYAVAQPGGGPILYAKRTDQLEGHPIPGTANGSQPVFSPDGQWLAFEVGTKEKKVRLDGSAPVTIADGGADNGADWTTTNELVVGSTGKMQGLSHVSVAGGEPLEFTKPDSAKGELDHLWPIALPDGRTIVLTIWSGALATAQLGITSLDDGRVTPLNVRGIRPLAVLDGALVYLQADGAVMAVPLNARRRRVTGKPVPVLDPVPVGAANNGNSEIFISRGGALVSALGTHRAQLAWIGRDGVSHPISSEVRDFSAPRLSPDGRRIAVIVSDGTKSDVWIYELATGTLSRLTTVESVTSAEWTRDGSRIVYTAAGAGGSRAAVWAQKVGVAAPPEMLTQISSLSPYADITPDRHSLLVQSLLENAWGVVRIPLDSGGAVRPFSVARNNSMGPRLAPDGRRVALNSDESGAFEVYVRSFPDPSAKVQVSVGGGGAPVWSADGTQLYYASGNVIVEARLAAAPDLRVVSRDTAFTRIREAGSSFGQANYDVTRDGSRLVVPVAQAESYQLVVVPNWLTEFRQKLAANPN
ncbi:MAG: protein kinase [Gemmatimonadales bacterium]